MLSLERAYKNVWHGAIAHNSRPQMLYLLRFMAIFRAFPFLAPPPSLPNSFPYLFPLPFQPASPLSRRGEQEKLNYCEQNALSVIKTHDHKANSEHNILYLSARQSRMAGHIMFSTCPFVRPFVRLFVVCCQLMNPILLRKQINWFQHKLAQISPPGRGHKRSTLGVRRSNQSLTGGWSYVWKPGGDFILDPLSRV